MALGGGQAEAVKQLAMADERKLRKGIGKTGPGGLDPLTDGRLCDTVERIEAAFPAVSFAVVPSIAPVNE
ncbi:hypothetical protein HAHE_28980 [Haloferula helveola]|uniref:Uncharacterized protein n=1 Tax=Haloferula helveola TaxID=490095 RepID=A0ABM7RHH8_9BACT|nr:hypothetical protein HAHE_28980 [Haloferula helveola]